MACVVVWAISLRTLSEHPIIIGLYMLDKVPAGVLPSLLRCPEGLVVGVDDVDIPLAAGCGDLGVAALCLDPVHAAAAETHLLLVQREALPLSIRQVAF